jgi:hypothetical protein
MFSASDMLILTPKQIAAHRESYMFSLAMALMNGNVIHWQSAAEEEREEARGVLIAWGGVLPDEEKQALQHREIREAEVRRALKIIKQAERKAAGKTTAKAKSPEKPSA